MKKFRLKHLRIASFGLVSMATAFLIGLQTSGNVRTVDTSEAAVARDTAFHAPLRGDIDDDGELTVKDAAQILTFAEGLETPSKDQVLQGDVDSDYTLTAKDALRILNTLAAR